MSDYIIDIEHLSKSFGQKEILIDITLKVKRGESIVTLGKSGTGKSVTLLCIVGLILPDLGTLKVFDKSIPDLSEKELNEVRKKIGFLFQSGALYDSMSVRENLEFPLIRHFNYSRDELNEKVETVLNDVGLIDSIDKMPSELSGGMRKRIGLARTIIMRPEIILYDEPTTGLDPATTREISYLIKELNSAYNITSLIVTHDMACTKITAQRILVLKNGIYFAEGSFDELSNSNDDFVKSFFI
jgi:phospholipid/cholesterol/gamma-HCH transport system ATP-binding protein